MSPVQLAAADCLFTRSLSLSLFDLQFGWMTVGQWSGGYDLARCLYGRCVWGAGWGTGEAGLGAQRQGMGTRHPAGHHTLYLSTHSTRRHTHCTRRKPGKIQRKEWYNEVARFVLRPLPHDYRLKSFTLAEKRFFNLYSSKSLGTFDWNVSLKKLKLLSRLLL